jgi:hypothetical protein
LHGRYCDRVDYDGNKKRIIGNCANLTQSYKVSNKLDAAFMDQNFRQLRNSFIRAYTVEIN